MIFKTNDKQEMDGFPKVWIREAKNTKTAERTIKNMLNGAWYLWRIYEGTKLKEFCNKKLKDIESIK